MFTPETVTIQIQLDLAKQHEEVYLLSALSQWKPESKFAFQWTPQGYVLALELLQGNLLECRISRGEHEEVGHEGLKRNPRILAADRNQQVSFEVLGFRENLLPEVTRTGHIEEHLLYSPELQEEVKLLVYLPPQYFSQPEAVFPVVYMHDGHNVFDRSTSSYGFDWQADETAEEFAAAGHPVVLVGIWTLEDKRMAYYVPFPSRLHGHQAQGLDYLSFIADTLKPWIDRHFRVSQDLHHTAICGSSLGGIISLYAALNHPEVFGVAGIMSPALWVGEYRSFDDVKPVLAGVRCFVDMGDREGTTLEEAAHLVRQAKQIALLISQQGSEVELLIGKDHLHHESAWAERFPQFLKFFLRL
ncbi:alpha/beta hydrolase [Deinococcus roseus]|uniref:Phosphonate ABC transporter ATP-binding protein n=1 Tax=Deinococcus roseus TaxID=392414 RepID=A0ABQ2CVA6_9DEIO|nr:alpha/beta hydrolase-fold protein [Deinococcus roseus]GGJ20722.1 phosphonate ABC transporter ATP-binding protein [Deinococcus roseus]